MNDQFSTVDRVAWHIAAALEPLRAMLTSEDAQREFVREELGIDAPDAFRSMGVDLEAVDAVISALDILTDALGAEEPDCVAVARRSGELAAAVALVASSLTAAGTRASEGLDPAFVAASRIVEELPRRLLDWIVVCHLEDTSLASHKALRVLGIVEVEEVEADPDTFTDPARSPISSARSPHSAVHRSAAVDRGGVRVGHGPRHPGAAPGTAVHAGGLARCSSAARMGRLQPPRCVVGPLRSGERQRAAAAAAAAAQRRDHWCGGGRRPCPIVLPAKGERRQGLALLPFAEGALAEEIELDLLGIWRLAIKGTFDLQAGVGIVARPGDGPRVVADIDGEGAAASGTLEVGVARDPSAEPLTLVSFAGDSGLFVTGIGVRAAALLDAGKAPELLLEAGVKSALLRVRMGDADGFLQSVVPDLDLTFDAAVGFSTVHGAYFVGGSSLRSAARPIGGLARSTSVAWRWRCGRRRTASRRGWTRTSASGSRCRSAR